MFPYTLIVSDGLPDLNVRIIFENNLIEMGFAEGSNLPEDESYVVINKRTGVVTGHITNYRVYEETK